MDEKPTVLVAREAWVGSRDQLIGLWVPIFVIVCIFCAGYAWMWWRWGFSKAFQTTFCLCLCGGTCTACSVCHKTSRNSNMDRDIELGEIHGDMSAGTGAEGARASQRWTGRERLHINQRLVARSLGSILGNEDEDGGPRPPTYEDTSRVSEAEVEAAQAASAFRCEMPPEPPDYGQATGDPTPEMNVPPPIYVASDPHPRSPRRYISFRRINSDVIALQQLHDASEDSDERLGFNMGIQKLQGLRNYAQGRIQGQAERPGVYIDAHVLDPVVRLADVLLRPKIEMIRELQLASSP